MRLLALLLLLLLQAAIAKRATILQKIDRDPDLSRFSATLKNDSSVRKQLHSTELTIFVPTNDAIATAANIQLLYHLVPRETTGADLDSRFLTTEFRQLPIWTTKTGSDVFVNDARLIRERSAYLAGQTLHVIDRPLDPVLHRLPDFIPNAYDFLTLTQYWDVGNYGVELYRERVKTAEKQFLFQDCCHTFFVPVDEGFTDWRLKMVDRYVIEGHVVPNRVLFTRPAPKLVPFETLANGDYIHAILSFDREGLVRSNTILGDSNHRVGEIVAEIARANIPVKNGVVHLIKRPLMVFDRKLTLFPFQPILTKVRTDPFLDVTYRLGELVGFNRRLADRAKKYTYFAPRDRAWAEFTRSLPSGYERVVSENSAEILSRHLIDSVYRMSRLKTGVKLTGRTLRAWESSGAFFLAWKGHNVRVHRADYECTNGVVHVVDWPLLDLEDLRKMNASAQTGASIFSPLFKFMFG